MTKPSHIYCKDCKDWNGSISKCMEICVIPMKIMEEWEQYRAIGTVEECWEAVEKQKVKEPDIEGDGYSDGHLIYDTWICQNCGKHYEIDYDDYDYCPNCGQHIDTDWR